MRRGKTTAAALVCGAVCAVCVLLYVQDVNGKAEAARAEALARYGGEQLEVCVAKRDIAAGEAVDAAAVDTRLWVADLLPADAVRAREDVVGRRAASPIFEGEVISQRRFEGQTASLEVPIGLTAVSVPAREVQAVGGALEPGMTVDVYATGGASTTLLAQGVLVLATSASASGREGSGSATSSSAVSWVTLAVEPQRVQELVAATQAADVYFVLPGEKAPAPEAPEQPSSGSEPSEDRLAAALAAGQEGLR